MDLVFIIEELRKLEGVNASFDYGVELLVMCIKEHYDDIVRTGNIGAVVYVTKYKWRELFRYDKVCRQGFEVGSNLILELV